ncbi:MAG: DMT family transporter [Breznakibacter sp.]
MKGVLYVLLAEFFFAASSVAGKFALAEGDIPGIELTFFRFLLGTVIGFTVMLRSKESFVPRNPSMVALRAVFNAISAMCFYQALKYTTVTNTNMLGMTYPLWVVLFAPLVIREKFEWKNLLYMGLALLGVYLVVHPNFGSINRGDIYAFFSGVTASVAVLALRQARRYDSTPLIIFYLMATALVINAFLLLPAWVDPTARQWVFILVSGLLGVLAQLSITQGYKYIEATRGSLVSSSRILMAGAMGVIFFSDKLSVQILAGAVLILGSQYGLIRDKLRNATALK